MLEHFDADPYWWKITLLARRIRSAFLVICGGGAIIGAALLLEPPASQALGTMSSAGFDEIARPDRHVGSTPPQPPSRSSLSDIDLVRHSALMSAAAVRNGPLRCTSDLVDGAKE